MQYLNPRNDVAFKKIFGDANNKDILIHFLNDVLDKKNEQRIVDVTLPNTNQLPEIAGSKESVLDVLCTDNNDVQYIVEMQVSGHKGFEKRAQYYAAKAYSSQAKEGDEYYNLKEVIFLAILDFTMFPNKAHYKSDHVILDKQNYEHNLKDFYFTFIELPKFTKTNPQDLVTYEEKWCYFFKHASELDNMRIFLETIKNSEDNNIVGGCNNVIQKAYNVLEAHNWTEEELRIYERVEKIRKDAIARDAYIIDEAEARGEARGEAKAKIEIARNLKQANVAIETIVQVTELSQEEILKI